MRKTVIVGLIVLVFFVALNTLNFCWAETSSPNSRKTGYSVASWYGPNFHGKKTASGQIFDMYNYTCAHKEYPFGTWLKITNIMNYRTTFCMVNDRGPLVSFRDLDLSYAAAKMLDMITLGICVVRIENLGVDTKYMKAIKDFFNDYSLIKHLQHKRKYEF